MSKVIITDPREKDNLNIMKQIDSKMLELRNALRSGKIIDWNMEEYFAMKE